MHVISGADSFFRFHIHIKTTQVGQRRIGAVPDILLIGFVEFVGHAALCPTYTLFFQPKPAKWSPLWCLNPLSIGSVFPTAIMAKKRRVDPS